MGRPTGWETPTRGVLPQVAGRTALLILAYLMAPKREVEAWGFEGTGCYGAAPWPGFWPAKASRS